MASMADEQLVRFDWNWVTVGEYLVEFLFEISYTK